MEKKEYINIYITNNSIQNFVKNEFNNVKPINLFPFYSVYYISIELYVFLTYLDEWSNKFYYEVILKLKNKKI